MKKILVSLSILLASLNALGNNNEAEPIYAESQTTASVMEVLVYANNAVDDFCDYFSGSWADVGISVYCKFLGGDVFTCTAYRVVKAACGINGAIKLYIEGDISGALRKTISAADAIYNLSKISSKEYQLSEVKAANMTPRSEWY